MNPSLYTIHIMFYVLKDFERIMHILCLLTWAFLNGTGMKLDVFYTKMTKNCDVTTVT